MSETQSVGTKKRASANRLKRRLDKDTSLEDLLDGWTQCCYLVPRKLKLCNVARTDGSIYCGNHQPSESAIVQATGDDAGSSTKHSKSQERIPCPIDSTHSIFKHNLRYHISVCTKAKQNNAMSELPYYRLNCNSYDPSANVLCGPCDNGSSEVANIDPQSLAVKVNSVYNDIMAQYFSSGAVNTIQEGGELIIPTNTSTVRAADGASTAGTTTAGTETATTSTSTIKIVDLALADKITSKLGQELKSQRKLRHVDQDILIVQQMIDNGLIQHSGNILHQCQYFPLVLSVLHCIAIWSIQCMNLSGCESRGDTLICMSSSSLILALLHRYQRNVEQSSVCGIGCRQGTAELRRELCRPLGHCGAGRAIRCVQVTPCIWQ